MTRAVLLLLALAAPTAAQTQADLNRRSAGGYQAADAALNAEYRRAMTHMAAEDKGRADDLRRGFVKPDGDPTYQAALLASQRAWLAYRDRQCTLAGFEFRGGSASSMARGQCLTDLTRARTAELRQIQTSFAPK